MAQVKKTGETEEESQAYAQTNANTICNRFITNLDSKRVLVNDGGKELALPIYGAVGVRILGLTEYQREEESQIRNAIGRAQEESDVAMYHCKKATKRSGKEESSFEVFDSQNTQKYEMKIK
jgi:hypothetical protein